MVWERDYSTQTLSSIACAIEMEAGGRKGSGLHETRS